MYSQLEDAEFAKTAAIKARQCAEADLSELTSQLEEAQRSRKEAEDRCARVSKDRAEIQTQVCHRRKAEGKGSTRTIHFVWSDILTIFLQVKLKTTKA